MATLKYSRQREAIKQQLMRRRDHPTAEMIYDSLREEDPKLSLGTVYRNLALLTEMGEIARIVTGDGPDHFDGDRSRHDHFICKNCHQIVDVHLSGMEQVLNEAMRDLDGELDGAAVYLTGVCGKCLRGNRKA